MIIGNINTYKSNLSYLPSTLSDVLNHLYATDFSDIPNVDFYYDDQIKIIITEPTLSPREEKDCEIHFHTLDLHFVLKGQDTIYFTSHKGNLSTFSHNIENDSAFINSQLDIESILLLQEGDFCIIFPNEPHAPCCNRSTSTYVKKVIVKIPFHMVI